MKKTGWVLAALAAVMLNAQVVMAEALSAAKEQELIESVLSIYEPHGTLVQAGQTPDLHKCGFGIMAEVRHLWPQLSAETQELLKQYVEARPDRQKFYDVPGISLRIHYDTTGTDSVDMRHGLDTDGVPLYVKRVAEIYQEVWHEEITEMGYPQPPADDFYPEGGTAAYDVYITNLSLNFYGLTHGDVVYQDGPSGPYRMTSYVELDNDYQGYSLYNPDEWDLILAVTAAHEFFHSIQYGIDAYEFLEGSDDYSVDVWWHEMSATWMEDMVYDEVNDYYYYLPGFFDHPNWALTTQARGNYEYGACVWPRYLSERFGNDIIRDIWEQCGDSTYLNSIGAWSEQIDERGSSLDRELGRFRLWCYYSGARHRSFAFAEGAQYPTINYDNFVSHYSSYPLVDSLGRLVAPEYLGAAYLEFARPDAQPGDDFKIGITHDNFDLWAITAAGINENSDPVMFSTTSITSPLLVPDWLNYERIMVIPIPFNLDYSLYKKIPGQKIIYEVSDTLPGIQGDEIKIIRPNPLALEAEDGMLWLPISRESKGETEILIYTAAGELVRGGRDEVVNGQTPYYIKEGTGQTAVTFVWDGCNKAGEKVASGVYVCYARLGELTSLQKVAVFRK